MTIEIDCCEEHVRRRNPNNDARTNRKAACLRWYLEDHGADLGADALDLLWQCPRCRSWRHRETRPSRDGCTLPGEDDIRGSVVLACGLLPWQELSAEASSKSVRMEHVRPGGNSAVHFRTVPPPKEAIKLVPESLNRAATALRSRVGLYAFAGISPGRSSRRRDLAETSATTTARAS